MQQENIGYKVIENPLNKSYQQLFKGQTSNDWSAIYIQLTPQHAMRYIYTKYELFDQVSLAKFTFPNKVKFIKITHESIKNSMISSKEKALLTLQILQQDYPNLNSEKPLVQQLGELQLGLIMEDSENDLEYIVPHNIMQAGIFNMEIIYQFECHKIYRFRTIKICLQTGETKDIEADKKDQIHLQQNLYQN